MTHRILITGAGGPAAISFFKALRRSPYEIFMADMSPLASGLYLVGANRRLLVPRGDAENFTVRLLELCQAHRIDTLVPTVDSELLPLSLQRPVFDAVGTHVLVAPPLALAKCLDKWQLAETMRDHPSIPVPITELVDEEFCPSRVGYPFVTKPRSGSGSRGVTLVRSKKDLAAVPRDGSYIAQSYLEGEEYSVDVLNHPTKGPIAAVPRARLRVDSGVAVASRAFHDSELEDLGKRVAAALGAGPIANVQVRRDGLGVARLLEVNPRVSGTMALTVEAGVNMPLLSLFARDGLFLSGSVGRFKDLAAVRYLEERFIDSSELDALVVDAEEELPPTLPAPDERAA